MNFDTCFDRLIGNEGGYDNDPNDPGGETNWGVTWPTLRRAIAANILPAGTTIANLTRDQSKAIYRALYWDAMSLDAYPLALAFQLFDTEVNSGEGESAELLQKALGVPADGKIGPVTQAAVAAANPIALTLRVIKERLRFLDGLQVWNADSRGFANRIANNIEFAAQDLTATP